MKSIFSKIEKIFLLLIPTFFFIINCNNNSTSKVRSAEIKDSTVNRGSIIDSDQIFKSRIRTKLDTLILYNYRGNPQLKKVLIDASLHEKLIFQFYKLSNNKLTLAVWPSRHRNQGVDPMQVQILTNWHTSILNIAHEAIFLGDQQIKDTTQFNFLKGIVNNPEDSLIFFMPKIVNNHIIYDLGSGNPKDTITFTIKKIQPIPVATDPSPPAPAN